jgi:hypothetical protein
MRAEKVTHEIRYFRGAAAFAGDSDALYRSAAGTPLHQPRLRDGSCAVLDGSRDDVLKVVPRCHLCGCCPRARSSDDAAGDSRCAETSSVGQSLHGEGRVSTISGSDLISRLENPAGRWAFFERAMIWRGKSARPDAFGDKHDFGTTALDDRADRARKVNKKEWRARKDSNL